MWHPGHPQTEITNLNFGVFSIIRGGSNFKLIFGDQFSVIIF